MGKTELVDSLQKELDRYGSLLTLLTQIMRLSASLAHGEKCWKKSYEDTGEACREFKMDRKVIQ